MEFLCNQIKSNKIKVFQIFMAYFVFMLGKFCYTKFHHVSLIHLNALYKNQTKTSKVYNIELKKYFIDDSSQFALYKQSYETERYKYFAPLCNWIFRRR